MKAVIATDSISLLPLRGRHLPFTRPRAATLSDFIIMDKNSIISFIAGAAAGAAIAILFAPDKGSNTREKIVRKAQEGAEAAKNEIAAAKEAARNLKENLRETGSGIKENLREKALEKLDDLERALERL